MVVVGDHRLPGQLYVICTYSEYDDVWMYVPLWQCPIALVYGIAGI